MSTDHRPGLTGTSRALLELFVIIALAVATGILADHTVGEALSPRQSGLIGFAVALLVVVTVICLWVLWDPNRGPVLPLALALVGCGTACVLVSLALQFYLASVAADSARRAGDLFSERARAGQAGSINVNANVPTSVPAVGYLALLGGLWLAAVGIRIGMGRAPAGPPPLPRTAGPADEPAGPVSS